MARQAGVRELWETKEVVPKELEDLLELDPGVSSSAQAAIKKCHRLMGETRSTLSLSSQDWKSGIREPAQSGLGRVHLPAWRWPPSCYCPHMAFPSCVSVGRDSNPLSPSS